MSSGSTEEWRRFGQHDPLFAVASHEGKRGNWDEAEFYELGRSDWADFRAHWERYANLRGTCVELGCGAGRVTAALVDTFSRVVGLDVSPDMLERARRVADAEFQLVDGTSIPLADATADAVFTCHVLQHLERPEDVAAYLREARRVLRPGGTVMAHLLLDQPLSLARRTWGEAKLRAVRRLPNYTGVYGRVRRYRPETVRTFFEAAGFHDVELCEFRVKSNGDPHAFWFGRA